MVGWKSPYSAHYHTPASTTCRPVSVGPTPTCVVSHGVCLRVHGLVRHAVAVLLVHIAIGLALHNHLLHGLPIDGSSRLHIHQLFVIVAFGLWPFALRSEILVYFVIILLIYFIKSESKNQSCDWNFPAQIPRYPFGHSLLGAQREFTIARLVGFQSTTFYIEILCSNHCTAATHYLLQCSEPSAFI